MTTYKVSELEGAALDWAVAKAEQGFHHVSNTPEPPTFHKEILDFDGRRLMLGPPFRPSTEWKDGGPIIEREDMALVGGERSNHARRRLAIMGDDSGRSYGSTNLIAAMRAYVASRFGEYVEIP